MKRVTEIIPFIAVVLGGFVAHRAFGADSQAIVDVAAGGASIFDAMSQHPAFLAFASFMGTEATTRLWPTRKKTSLFYFGREMFRILIVICTAMERVFDHLYQHPFAQKKRATPAETPAEVPKEPGV